jgi:hypothetical protein
MQKSLLHRELLIGIVLTIKADQRRPETPFKCFFARFNKVENDIITAILEDSLCRVGVRQCGRFHERAKSNLLLNYTCAKV